MIGDMVGVKSPIGRAVVMVPLYVDETLRGYEPAGVHRDGEGVRVAHRPGLGGQEQRGGAEVGQHPPYPMYIASSEYNILIVHITLAFMHTTAVPPVAIVRMVSVRCICRLEVQ